MGTAQRVGATAGTAATAGFHGYLSAPGDSQRDNRANRFVLNHVAIETPGFMGGGAVCRVK